MSRADRWAGPYCRGEDAAGAHLPWDPTTSPRRAPTGTVRLVVRWRAPGSTNPRKRTFAAADVAAASDLARQIAAAVLLNPPSDPRALPVFDRTPATTTAALPTAPGPIEPPGYGERRSAYGEGRSEYGERRSPKIRPSQDDATRRSREAGTTPGEPAGAQPTRTPMTTSLLTADTIATVTVTPAADLGPTVADFRAQLQAEHGPRWQDTRQLDWWSGQLDILEDCYRYAEDHPAVARHGVEPGASKHIALLDENDFAEALFIRRATNLAAAHRNRQRLARYDKARERWERAQLRSGGGRRPAKPELPAFEPEYDPTTPQISARTEEAFAMTQTFLFDRASDRGLFGAARANPWRRFKPRGHGGRRNASQATPFRKVDRGNPLDRNFPGAGFFIDLGDALAELGAVLPDGRHVGERYRYLPWLAQQSVLRPGELSNLQACHIGHGDTAGLRAVPEPGWHLKSRDAGVARTLPLADLTAVLAHHHRDSGYGTDDGFLFASPTGCRFDASNWIEDFLRPALDKLGPLWPECFPGCPKHGRRRDSKCAGCRRRGFPDDTLKLFRKAGISGWLAYGLDTSVAADWAGHDETTQLRNYKGVIAAAGGRRRWVDANTYTRQALLDAPPRGDGELATRICAWLHTPTGR